MRRKRILSMGLITAITAALTLAGAVYPAEAAWQKFTYGKDKAGRPIQIYENGCIVQDGALIGCISEESEIVVPDGVREISGWPRDSLKDGRWLGYDSQGKEIVMDWSWKKEVEKVTIPDSVRRIKDSAGMRGPSEIDCPETVTIEGNPFRKCYRLADENGLIIVNDVLCGIRMGNYNGTIEVPEGVTRIAYGIEAGEGNSVQIENLILPKSLRRIDSNVFFSIPISNLIVKEGLEWISDSAFENCTIKRSMELPNSLKYIGTGAFKIHSRSWKLNDKFLLPKSVEFWGDYVFLNSDYDWQKPINPYNDRYLHMQPGEKFIFQGDRLTGYADLMDEMEPSQEIEVPERARIIGSYAFASNGNSYIIYGYYERKVTLPEGVEEIEYDAFSSPAVKEVVLPTTLQKIGDRAFQNSEIKEAVLYEGLTVIGDNAFENTQLQSVSIPSSVESVGEGAFLDCRELGRVSVSKDTALGEAVFKGCDGLADENGLVSVNGVLFDAFCCKEKKLALNPAEISKVSRLAFMDASALHYVYAPEGVEISEGAFGRQVVYFGTADSEAERAAKECGARYFAVENEAEFNRMADMFMMGEDQPDGDVDFDGEATLEDAQLTLQEALGIAHRKSLNALKTDADGDGKVTIEDALAVLMLALGIA